ncbi:MAG: hypothetical protein WC821_00530 [archaeon]|jgi:hypothetical protein
MIKSNFDYHMQGPAPGRLSRAQALYRGQGTIEYLVIISIVVVISLGTVSMVTGMLDDSGSAVSSTSADISSKAGSINILESEVNFGQFGGNYLVRVGNNTGGNITITSIVVGSDSNSYSSLLPQGSAQNFKIVSNAVCTLGQAIPKSIRINYTSAYGLSKSFIPTSNIVFNCSNWSATNLVG